MKKEFSFCIYVLLLGTVFVSVRLTAQQPNEKTDDRNNKPLTDKHTAVPYLVWDKETWKRTRIPSAKEKLALVKVKHDAAAQGGEVWFYCDAQIAVADAEIALYRNTGEEKKWQSSLEQKLQWT